MERKDGWEGSRRWSWCRWWRRKVVGCERAKVFEEEGRKEPRKWMDRGELDEVLGRWWFLMKKTRTEERLPRLRGTGRREVL